MCILLLFTQTWLIDGLIAPCRVSGGSMAFALWGAHRLVICPDCGFAFACEAQAPPPSPRAICPNCGSVIGGIDSLPDLDGDRLLVDRWAFQFRRPRRWEIVAFRHPLEAKKIVIKRVAGLPGESLQIKNGDLYLNGQIQRKSLDCQRSMAVLVYDAGYPPAVIPGRPALPPRWQVENEKSRWNSAQGRFSHHPHPSPLPEGEGTIDWLVYHNWRRTPNQKDEVQECPVTDIMPYNQGLPRREEDVHVVSDLMLCFRLEAIAGQGKFFTRAIDGKDVFQVEIDPPSGVYRATRNGREISPENNGFVPNNKSLDVTVSLLDRQFLLAINNRTVFCLPLDDPISKTEPTSQPFAIGVEQLGTDVADLRIYRDVYYTHPIGWDSRRGQDQPVQLAGNEYFVLGDNSSISEDSRTWPSRFPIVDDLLIGKPLMIIFPAKSFTIGPWQFQVPDPGRIGYIR